MMVIRVDGNDEDNLSAVCDCRTSARACMIELLDETCGPESFIFKNCRLVYFQERIVSTLSEHI